MITRELVSTAAAGRLEQSAEAILAATSRIVSDTRQREQLFQERRSEPRWIVHQAVRVTPLQSNASSLDPSGEESVTAFIRDISTHGVGLLHAHPFGSRRVMVAFSLLDGDTIAVVLELKWCCSLGDFGFASGGTAMGVVKQPDPPASQSDK